MNLFSIDEFKTLTEQPDGSFVSIYMPTHHLGAITQQNSIRCKNLMRQTQEFLIDAVEPENIPNDAPLAAVFSY
jgi:hypothetical protein